MNTYMPILKAKAGELRALTEASDEVKASTFPLLEMVPPSEETNVALIEDLVRALATKLSRSWGMTSRLALDVGYLDGPDDLDGVAVVELLAEACRDELVQMVPVVRVGDPQSQLEAVSRVDDLDGRGVLIRLAADDLREDSGDIEVWLSDTLRDLGLEHGVADLLLDFGAMNTPDVMSLSSLVARSHLRGLPSINEWRSVTVAAGAFPTGLETVPTGGTGLIPRLDAEFWRELHHRKSMPEFDYGDYAIQHPAMTPPGGFAPAPQIRYAVEDNWRIHKGRRNDRAGHRQFYELCQRLVESREASPPDLSWGDDYVALAAASAPPASEQLITTGNATTWRAIGTSHHMALVTRRLATDGEP